MAVHFWVHDGIIHVTARFGSWKRLTSPVRYVCSTDENRGIDRDRCRFVFLVEDQTDEGRAPIPAWRQILFIATFRLSTDGAESFCLPQNRTLIEGSRIEVRLLQSPATRPKSSRPETSWDATVFTHTQQARPDQHSREINAGYLRTRIGPRAWRTTA